MKRFDVYLSANRELADVKMSGSGVPGIFPLLRREDVIELIERLTTLLELMEDPDADARG